MGNPNVGKSVVFSRLTGADVIASNYPGTTVDFSKGRMRIDGERVEIIDAPGAYSLEPMNKAEEVASKMFEEADIIINVIDVTNLERNLFLTLQILERDKPVVIALNLWDETRHLGIYVDEKKLEKILGVPVIPTCAITGEGIKTLVSRIKEAKSSKIKPTRDEARWIEIGSIIKKVERVEHRHHSLVDRLADATIKPFTGIPIAVVIILFSFSIVRLVGESLISFIFDPLFYGGYKPLIMRLSDLLGPGFLHDIVIGRLTDGEVEFMRSMGLLTTGLYVPIGVVLPYIIAFYFVLSILEDSGYLPRLATLVDNVFHKLGMHGYGIIPVFLGLGCNVPGALATRTLETRKQRLISATLLGIAIPCMAQSAMIFGVLGSHGIEYMLMVFLTLSVLYIVIGVVLDRVVKGESPEIFLEIPPYHRPSLRAVTKKTWMRIRWFLSDAIPFLFLGVLVVNVLYVAGILRWLGNALSPITEGLFGLPGEASIALVMGFLRKDLAVGLLLPLGMNPLQLVIAVTILTIYFPCVATFAVLIKELGVKDMMRATLIMIATAIVVGAILKIIILR